MIWNETIKFYSVSDLELIIFRLWTPWVKKSHTVKKINNDKFQFPITNEILLWMWVKYSTLSVKCYSYTTRRVHLIFLGYPKLRNKHEKKQDENERKFTILCISTLY